MFEWGIGLGCPYIELILGLLCLGFGMHHHGCALVVGCLYQNLLLRLFCWWDVLCEDLDLVFTYYYEV